MNENIRHAIDWLNEITTNPGGWRMFYSESETKSFAEAALALLKKQEAHVLTLDEALDLQENTPYPCIFVDIKWRDDVFLSLVTDEIYGDYHSDDFTVHRPWICAERKYSKTEYGKSIRFWNLFPTDEQRQAVKWE